MQLDTRLPLAAVGERINPAGIMQQAAQFRQQQQANALQQRLAELKASREAETLDRRQRAGKSAYEQLQGIRQGQPAVMEPEPMLPGQVLNQPAFGAMREKTPAIPGREPSAEEYQRSAADALFREGDYDGAFDVLKQMRTAGQYGNSLATGIDNEGNLVFVQPGGPSGARVVQGVRPPEGMTVVNAGNERILIGGKTGREQSRVPVQVDPTAIYTQGAQAQRQERGAQLDVLTEAQKEAIRLQNVGQMAEQKAKGEAKAERDIDVAAKVRSAEDAISELVPLKQALAKLPSPAALRIEGAKAFFGMENPRIQAALGDVQRISGRMLEYVNRLPGAATDKDREVFMASAGVLNDPNTPASRKIAAADSAIQSYQRLIQKYGKGQSTQQRQQVNILPPASQLPGKIATDNATGIRYRSDGTKWVRVP
ncbi:MAG: hypothetical protein IPH54_16595 [Rhodoferax sp.]|nr:hypothetical protein [Rhodoferax sp.]